MPELQRRKHPLLSREVLILGDAWLHVEMATSHAENADLLTDRPQEQRRMPGMEGYHCGVSCYASRRKHP